MYFLYIHTYVQSRSPLKQPVQYGRQKRKVDLLSSERKKISDLLALLTAKDEAEAKNALLLRQQKEHAAMTIAHLESVIYDQHYKLQHQHQLQQEHQQQQQEQQQQEQLQQEQLQDNKNQIHVDDNSSYKYKTVKDTSVRTDVQEEEYASTKTDKATQCEGVTQTLARMDGMLQKDSSAASMDGFMIRGCGDHDVDEVDVHDTLQLKGCSKNNRFSSKHRRPSRIPVASLSSPTSTAISQTTSEETLKSLLRSVGTSGFRQ